VTKLGPAGADQASEANNLAGTNDQANILILILARQVLDLENGTVCGAIAGTNRHVEGLAGHQLGQA